MFYFALLAILRFAQDDKLGFVGAIYTVGRGLAPAAGEHSSPLQFVGNDLSVVPQNYIKIHGRAWKPAPTTGRRVVAPYARNIFFRVVAGDSPVRGNVCYNRVGRGLDPAAGFIIN